ncbi:Pathogenicity island protein [Bacillus sp. 179-C3.3 HS]|uniref:Pathogenicity island protein n=1 Tax=Bacillus sp. 179-C3.3 HS TaxID=3232162 RepID=UPI0039A0BEC3
MSSKLKSTFIKLAASLFLISALALPTLPKDANATKSQATYQVENLNDSELKMTFHHASVHIDSKGNAILEDKITNEKQVLPKKSTDKNNHPVTLHYEKVKNGILIKVVSEKTSGNTSTQSVGKCILGTSGGAVTGGGTLGLAGAAVGTVTIPGIGTVGAGAVGAITGAVGGALTGAAASCF